MPEITFTLISDGPSDRVLLPILRWLILRILPDCAVQEQWADFRRLSDPPRGLRERIKQGLLLYECDLLFVHRDAENQGSEARRREIQYALEKLGTSGQELPPAICVIPVRMTEAWLLFDERAIRVAAGNPSGTIPLNLPPLESAESLPDPKSVLAEVLKQASGLSGRRLKSFKKRLGTCVHLVAERIDDFSPLRVLPAFQAMEEDVEQCLSERSG